jgi:hypothetical protein
MRPDRARIASLRAELRHAQALCRARHIAVFDLPPHQAAALRDAAAGRRVLADQVDALSEAIAAAEWLTRMSRMRAFCAGPRIADQAMRTNPSG